MNRIVFDNENKKQYEIADSNGNVRGIISVDTTDLDIFTRAEEAGNNIHKILNDEKIQLSDDMEEKYAFELINKVDKLMKEQIDYIFGEGVSKIAFGDKKCLNIRNGKTLAEVFIEAIMEEVNKDFGRQAKINQKNINRYTRPYNTDHRRKYGKKRGK